MEREAMIVDGVRSPRGKGRASGTLHDIHPQFLLAQVLNALLSRVSVDPLHIDDVVIGSGSSQGDHGSDIARMAVLDAGWPYEVAGVTLNRFCGSGQQAVTFGAMGILSGQQEVVVAGGVDSMSRFPPPSPFDANNLHLRERVALVPQGISADLLATLEGFTREEVDVFAVESQRRAATAIAEGRFDGSIVPVVHTDGLLALDHEEHPRPSTTIESLANLEPSFAAMGSRVPEGYEVSYDEMCRQAYPAITAINHVHHAGNSSGVVDGASAVLVASSSYCKTHGIAPRARILMSAVIGAEPVVMLSAPPTAALRCLERAKMTVADIDLWEINEAFAAVVLKTVRDLNLDPQVVNVNGGAIALGHPIGATGPMLIQTALDELERTDRSTALVTMCTGGGMATATIIERC